VLAASPRRASRAAAALALSLLGAALLALFPAAVAQADVATAVTVWVEPPTVLEPYTPATFRAQVSPANAAGTVTFTWDGVAFGNAAVQSGQAVFESSAHEVGVHKLKALYTPAPGSGFAPSTSAEVTVTVNAIARLFLSRGNGTLVPPGSEVKPGERVTINALGYPAGSTVRFTLAGQPLPQTITVNGQGSGATELVVSTGLPSAVYQLVGQAQLKNAAFVFYIYNPPPQSSPQPTATAPVVAPSAGATSGGTGSGLSSGGSTSTGGTTATPGLADTGADTAPLLAWACLALGAGSALVSVAGRPQAPAPRHARR